MGPRRWSLLILLAVSIAACAEGERGKPRVLVAVSFSEAASGVVGEAGIVVPAASSSHARRIIDGAPADVFLSANREWMDFVAQHGLIVPESRQVIARNELVLVVPGKGRSFDLRSFRGRIAMGDPSHVPAGIYGRRALESAGVWGRWEPSIVPTADVRHALALVERDEVDLGVVYLTDATQSKKVSIVHRFEDVSLAAVYEIALIKGGDRGLLQRLTSRDAQVSYRRLGFRAPQR